MLSVSQNIGNKKLQKLVNTALDLFWRFGFQRVTVEEICLKSGVSKMTFYKYYKDKTELVKFIFKEIINQYITAYNHIMKQDIPFREKVVQAIRLKQDLTDNMSEEFFRDFSRSGNPGLVSFFEEQNKKGVDIIYHSFLEAQKRGEIRTDIKLDFILYFLNHMMIMAKDDRLLAIYNSPQELTMEMIRFFFYGILPLAEPPVAL